MRHAIRRRADRTPRRRGGGRALGLQGARILRLISLAGLLLGAASVPAAAQSSYAQLNVDETVSAKTELLVRDVVVSAESDLLVSSDGSYFPAGGTAARVYATVDGERVTNESVLDWAGSSNPQEHTFNAIGVKRVGPGMHTIALIGEPLAGPFAVRAASNLAAMVRPPGTITGLELTADRGPFDFVTGGLQAGTAAPRTSLLTSDVGDGDVVALASGVVYQAAHAGDAMLGISLDGGSPGNGSALWTVQDLFEGAELKGPLFTHAFLGGLQGRHELSLDASEFPWNGGEDPANYGVSAGTRLVIVGGPMHVRGSAPTSQAIDDWWDYFGVGTSQGFPGVPPVGTDVPLASASVDVPAGHGGVVMFLAKTRVQGDISDVGGTASLRLAIDGQPVGSIGVQKLAEPNVESQRTVAASYLAAGDGALPPGRHTVTVYGRADGQFIHLAMVRDLNLLWLDDAMPLATLPTPPPPPPPSLAAPPAGDCGRPWRVKQERDRHATYSLLVPRRCTTGRNVLAALRVGKRRRAAAVRVTHVTFRLGHRRARVDRRPPFRARLPLSTRAVPTCQVSVLAAVGRKLAGRRLPPKRLRALVRVCDLGQAATSTTGSPYPRVH
jgi:hypothetical protein